MAMIRSQFLTLMVEGLREVFFLQYKEQEQVHPRIFDVQSSKKRKESYQGITGLGMLDVKPESEAITYEDLVEGYDQDFLHTAYAKGLRFSRELLDDEQYGVMKRRTEALSRSARYRKEYDHAKLFNNASATTYFSGNDDLALLSASHTLAAVPSTVWSNYSASTDLSLAALETAFTAIRTFKDDQNLLINMEPATLLIPPQLEYDAYEILNSSGKPYTADNEVNYFKGKLNVIVWPFITDTNAWFVLTKKSDAAPLSFIRTKVEFDSDGDFDTKDLKVSAYTRYSLGFIDPRFCYGSMGSS